MAEGKFDIKNGGPQPMPENPEFVETFRRNLVGDPIDAGVDGR